MSKLKNTNKNPGSLSVFGKISVVVLPLLCAVFSLCVGRINISPIDSGKAVLTLLGFDFNVPAQVFTVICSIRLPRVILAAFVGAGLSVSGCAFQSLFSNPLATPDTLGAASGASFGAALGILTGLGLNMIHTCAFIFGTFAVALTWLCSSKKGGNLSSAILSGIMISSLFSALVSLVKFSANSETQLPAITYFLMGSLNGAGFSTLMPGILIIFLSTAVLYVLRWRLNILPLSEDEARATGTNIGLLRAVTVVSSTAATAAGIAMCGQVGWIGLIVPHVCRMIFGSNHLALIPSSIGFGAAFMILADTLSRSVSAAEIPISILTAIIGAPFFIFLMRRSKGWQL